MAFVLGDVVRIRNLQVSACMRKVRHDSFRSADAHLAAMLFHYGAGARMLHVYRCPVCNAWHVGSHGKRSDEVQQDERG
jgi:hypothetical protein